MLGEATGASAVTLGAAHLPHHTHTLAATSAEKSTGKGGELNAVSSSGGAGAMGLFAAVLAIRDGGKTSVARFEGIGDRTAAEALRGTALTVPRSALPPLGEGEYYHADLIGLQCFDRAGAALLGCGGCYRR